MTAFLSKSAITLSSALATACCSSSTLAAADLALLRVTGPRGAAEFSCPPPKARPLVTRTTLDESRGLAEGYAKPLAMATPLANDYPSALKIGLWGDSHTASGTFADSVLEALRLPLSQTHPSFIAPTFGLKGVRQPLRRVCLSDDWQLALAYRSLKEGPEHFRKSLSALHTAQAGAFIWLDFRYPSAQTRVKWADIHIAKAESELVIGVTVDDGAESIVQLKPISGLRLRVQAENPYASLKMRVLAGAVRIEGIAPVYEGKIPIIMDVFSSPVGHSQRLAHRQHRPPPKRRPAGHRLRRCHSAIGHQPIAGPGLQGAPVREADQSQPHPAQSSLPSGSMHFDRPT